MSDIILKAKNISKQYRLGTVGTGTLRDDLKRNWARLRGKEDPFLKIGAVNDRSQQSTEDYVWALRNINFEVKQGEVLGIIGKNGAGKSTLLKILSRVTAPSTGVIKSRGRIASLLEVGTGFHHELTGRENIYLNGAILGMQKAEITRKLDEIIAFSGCERYIDTPTKRYSSGMTVRLAFAVAAHLEPEILVVDEVLAVGDAEFQKKAIGKMQDISQGEGRTVLFVSHNMASVQSLCTQGLVLKNGGINLKGDVDLCVNAYLNADGPKEGILEFREDRQGLGKIKFKKVEIFNSSGNISTTLLNGEDCIVQIILKNPNLIQVDNLRIDFGVNNSKGYRVSWMSTLLSKNPLKVNTSKELKIYLNINELPLSKGSYTLTCNLIVNGKNQDYIRDAVDFEVENGDFFGSGKVALENQGDLLLKHSFYS
ncbi:ABC transporter ATP-binding protein [Leeuwenhoekiella sp. CH_XMU1409-2]|uniref:ABC transporter ATP-binding protein n=1 Tax=Leeuwenhoekiella sp. CH_XMU1409-2 TaxID=3107768 RepID=UPI00300A9F15